MRLTLYILILLLLVACSCSSRNNKIESGNLIPEKDLISIITDLYITNGLLNIPKIRNDFSRIDSIYSYREVIEKHGYKKETMDKTMKYYFVKNPKKLIKIYDQALGKLSEMDSRFQKEEVLLLNRVSNTWTGKDSYSFPPSAGIESTDFDITRAITGVYTISYSVTLFPDDQAVNPRMTAYTCHPDSITTGKKHYLPSINYLKDGQPHIYSINVNMPDISHLHLRGTLYNFDNNPDDSGKHLRIDKISFSYISRAL
jgi:hypothetical protein